MAEPPAPWEINKAVADFTHNAFIGQLTAVTEYAVKSGESVIKSCLLLNGGSLVATLALIGNLVSKNNEAIHQIDGPSLKRCLLFFAMGLFSAGLAAGLGWIANFSQMIRLSSCRTNYIHPYVHETQIAKTYKIIAVAAQTACALTVTGSLFLFAIGCWSTSNLLIGLFKH